VTYIQHIHTHTCNKWPVAGLSPWRPWFDSRPLHGEFLLNQVTLEQRFLWVR